jgi:hypothetical protein
VITYLAVIACLTALSLVSWAIVGLLHLVSIIGRSKYK